VYIQPRRAKSGRKTEKIVEKGNAPGNDEKDRIIRLSRGKQGEKM